MKFSPEIHQTNIKINNKMSRTQTDKILDNKYEATDIDTSPINFVAHNDFLSSLSEEDKITYMMLMDKLDDVIKDSELAGYNIPDENGVYKKLNKVDINRVYLYVIKFMPTHSKMNLFGVIGDYFDISYHKLYDSLPNKFKEELIFELKRSGSYKDKSNGPLF
jgi:hypothetical protein